MSNARPLLLFPKPLLVSRDKSTLKFPPKTLPSNTQRRADKLYSYDTSLQTAINLLSELPGDPSRMLVLETVGSVDDIKRVANNIEGMEWQFEQNLGDLSDEENQDIYPDSPKPKNEKKSIYLSSTNLLALQAIKNLYSEWLKNPEYDFTPNTPLKNIFKQLIDLRFWNERDRLEGTEIIAFWKEELKTKGDSPNSECLFNVELTFFINQKTAKLVEEEAIKELEDQGASIVDRYRNSAIHYHALKVRLPIHLVKQAFDAYQSNHGFPTWLGNQKIKFCAPIPQSDLALGREQGLSKLDIPHSSELDSTFKQEKPVVALLDGLPIENHPLLIDRILLADPDQFSENYAVHHRKHGTSMLSLICHNDLNDPNKKSLSRVVYVRPIFRARSELNVEEYPLDCFIEDLIERSVNEIVKTHPSIKIINLSIGDENNPFHEVMSPLARLIDYLSWQHKILFVISAGNAGAFEIQEKRVHSFNYIETVLAYEASRRILSPAESINSLTIGSLNKDYSNPISTDVTNFLAHKTIHAPYSRIGFGFRGQIKPDLVVPGGSLGYRIEAGTYVPVLENNPFGQISASPGGRRSELLMEGQLSFGTSNSTAITTHHLAHLYESLIGAFSTDQLPSSYYAIVLKNLAIHSASWGDNDNQEIFNNLPSNSSFNKSKKRQISKFFGFGKPNFSRVIECTKSRASIMGHGSLKQGEKHRYILSIPDSLRNKSINMYTTNSWLTPTSPNSFAYRTTKMDLKIYSDEEGIEEKINYEEKEADENQMKKGTSIHRVFKLKKMPDNLIIDINCSKDAEVEIDFASIYSMCLTFESHTDLDIDIYQDLKSQILVTQAIRS